MIFLFLFITNTWSQTSGDVDVIFKNMITLQDVSRCDICANFYRVDTFHKFIGVQLSKTCDGELFLDHGIYGMVDAASDLSNFRHYLNARSAGKLKFITKICGRKLYQSLEMAKNMSNEYLERYFRNDTFMMARFIATPFFGRPCKKIARRIEMKLKSI